MRRSKKILISAVSVASLAGLAGPALASAATAAPAAPPASVTAVQQMKSWNLSGRNKVELVYEGSTYTYQAQFKQYGELLFGTLTDSYLPAGLPNTLPVNGIVVGNNVMFYVSYPSGHGYPGIQGDRAFIGTIGAHGAVSGNWTETGSEQGNGTFTFAHAVGH